LQTSNSEVYNKKLLTHLTREASKWKFSLKTKI